MCAVINLTIQAPIPESLRELAGKIGPERKLKSVCRRPSLPHYASSRGAYMAPVPKSGATTFGWVNGVKLDLDYGFSLYKV
jgi:hypothetical protein